MNTQTRVLSALATGGLTARQISARFRVTNPRDVIYRLRQDGHNIVLNENETSRGVTRRYELVQSRRRKSA